MKNKENTLELLRFCITGLICALLDFLVCKLLLNLCAPLNNSLSNIIATSCGFIIGVIANYVLSTFWVFKGKRSNEEVKSTLFIVLFVLLSAVALFLSIGTMELCRIVCNKSWNIDITQSDLTMLFTFTFWSDIVFWAYFISFCLKTIVGLVWNYFTRKYILYKEKKNEE